jgi:hypothetical protein
MTPKEKAEKLFNKFANVVYDRALTVMQYEICKQCALISVEELLYYSEDPESYIEFEEIKQEIEKL